ncbi:MAG TPA: hypothetical protein PKA53_09760 [Sphingobacterium sp.]|nr:hypothetical protein [Sphingobacterium sp.]
MKIDNLYRGVLVMALIIISYAVHAQDRVAFPGAEGFGRYATGPRGVDQPEVYIVDNLNDEGPGSFRDAVSKAGRFIVFQVSGVIQLKSRIAVAPNLYIAGHTAPGDGIVLYGRGVTFSGADHTIARYLRIRLGDNAGATQNEDASGIADGKHIILDHMSFTWGLDEVFSINWNRRRNEPDSITLQNCIIGQGLHRYNHSAGGLMQTSGKVSILRSLYISNKTRNPKVKGINEFVNNVVYNYGNANTNQGHAISGDAYILGGSAAISNAIILNNYFIGGPATPRTKKTPFSRGNENFNIYEGGNYFDNNQNGVLDGELIPGNSTWYPGLEKENFKTLEYYSTYPSVRPQLTAEQAFDYIVQHVGATLPARDEVDQFLVNELKSKGKAGSFVYKESDLPLSNGGLGAIRTAIALADSDNDGIPDVWEEKLGVDKDNPKDALLPATDQTHAGYLNIEVYLGLLAD